VSGDRARAARIAELTSDPDPFVALEAALALFGLRDPAAVSRLAAVTERPELTGEFREHLALARVALVSRGWPAAETSFRRALELNPYAVAALNDLGIALFSQKKLDAARQVWRQALEVNPQFEAARRNLEESEGIAEEDLMPGRSAPGPGPPGPP
jgi:Flp pilus assembly protein TadD